MDSICLSDREELLCENCVLYQTLVLRAGRVAGEREALGSAIETNFNLPLWAGPCLVGGKLWRGPDPVAGREPIDSECLSVRGSRGKSSLAGHCSSCSHPSKGPAWPLLLSRTFGSQACTLFSKLTLSPINVDWVFPNLYPLLLKIYQKGPVNKSQIISLLEQFDNNQDYTSYAVSWYTTKNQ